MKKISIITLSILLSGGGFIEILGQNNPYTFPRYTYTLKIKNHLKVDANDIFLYPKPPKNKEEIYMLSEMGMVSNDGKVEITHLWNHGKGVDWKPHYTSKGKKINILVSYNLGGPESVKPGTIAEFSLSKWFVGKSKGDTIFRGYYWWTDGRGKRIGEVMPINLSDERNNWYVEVHHICTPPRGARKSKAGCQINRDDSVAYAMDSYLKKRDVLISAGHFEGVIAPGESVEHEFDVVDGEHGDSIFATWNYTNIKTEETWTCEAKAEINHATILLPADTLFWSAGEVDSSFVGFRAGEGVEVRCLQLPEFQASDSSQEYVSANFKYPDLLADRDSFKLDFVRTDRGESARAGFYSVPGVDTTSCIVRHGDFRPTASWTFGDGVFNPINDTLVIPIIISREVSDEDWVYSEIIGTNRSDTIWFHHEIQGISSNLLLPVDFLPGELDQIDSLYLIITTALSPSSPDTLMAYINNSQGIEDLVISDLFGLHVYPNPFTNQVTFNYELINAVKVVLTIFDVNGQEIEQLINDAQSPGLHQITWKSKLAKPGLYFYSLQIGENHTTGQLFKMD